MNLKVRVSPQCSEIRGNWAEMRKRKALGELRGVNGARENQREDVRL